MTNKMYKIKISYSSIWYFIYGKIQILFVVFVVDNYLCNVTLFSFIQLCCNWKINSRKITVNMKTVIFMTQTETRRKIFESSKRFKSIQIWNCKEHVGGSSGERTVWANFHLGLPSIPSGSILVLSKMMFSNNGAFRMS